MRKIIMMMLLLASLLQANSSNITIRGNMNGDINKNRGDVIKGDKFDIKLKIVHKNQKYNYVTNISKIVKNDPKLLQKFKEQFGSIQNAYIRLESLGYSQKRLLKAIQIKLARQNKISLENQRVLNRVLGGIDELNINAKYIKSITTDTNQQVKEIRYIANYNSQLNEKILDGVQELNNKINHPNIIHDINWNLNSFCQEHKIKYIDEISFDINKFNATNTLDYKYEREKINCLKTLYSFDRQQNYEIHVFGSNANDIQKVVDAIVLYGEIDERNIFRLVKYNQTDKRVYLKLVAR